MSNPKEVYNTQVRANLPGWITYDDVRDQYVTANGKRFWTYKEAKWYSDYIIKFGSIIQYAETGDIPEFIADFKSRYYEAS